MSLRQTVLLVALLNLAYFGVEFGVAIAIGSRAAFLSARNDVLANVAIVAAGLATAATLSVWPDLGDCGS
jgi:Co/Zn/Cd efflux system component